MSSVKFVSGFNMPGYLPDSDPHDFEDFDEAKAHIVELLEDDIESEVMTAEHFTFEGLQSESRVNLESLNHAVELVQAWTPGEQCITVHGFAYWVHVVI